jgi:hypothetical protein
VVKLCRLRREADLDVAQALAIGQLSEGHYAELLGTRHRLDVAVAVAVFFKVVVAIDDAMKSLPRQEVHELGEKRLAEVHRRLQRKQSQKMPHRKFAIQIGDIKKAPNAAPAMGSKLMACILTGHN